MKKFMGFCELGVIVLCAALVVGLTSFCLSAMLYATLDMWGLV